MCGRKQIGSNTIELETNQMSLTCTIIKIVKVSDLSEIEICLVESSWDVNIIDQNVLLSVMV